MRSKSPRSSLDQNRGTARYSCFTRTWWRNNPDWPNGLEPHPGPKRTLVRNLSYREAVEYCAGWNMKNSPGRLSHKCEFEQQ